MWFWRGQWALDSWPNRLLAVALLASTLWFAVRQGHSVVGVFSRRADEVFVRVLRGWWAAIDQARVKRPRREQQPVEPADSSR
jgi:hypothetical protein